MGCHCNALIPPLGNILWRCLIPIMTHVYGVPKKKVTNGSKWSIHGPLTCHACVLGYRSSTNFMDHVLGGPQKTEQLIQSIFQDFALINRTFFSPCWIEHDLFLIIITPRSSNLVENFSLTLYKMSNFLWTVIFGNCPISRVPRHD